MISLCIPTDICFPKPPSEREVASAKREPKGACVAIGTG